jgi:flagellar biosynthesis protein FlhB
MSADREQKRYDATATRKDRAVREGNIARSSEAVAVAAFAAGVLTMFAVLPQIGAAFAETLRAVAHNALVPRFPSALPVLALLALAPAGGAMMGATTISLAQARGLRVSGLKVQLGRLDPRAGLKRMFGGEAIVAVARALAAFTVAFLALVPMFGELLTQATTVRGPGALALVAATAFARACTCALAVASVFAVADYVLARRRWLRDLKMTHDEMKRDRKENDGDPHTRSRRATMHRTLVRGSLARVREASFLIVNPTHIAIAIKYAPPSVPVPEILVRAADEGALRVRALAQTAQIPIVENVALARALFADGRAGRAIPSATFVAVAHVIAALMREGVLTSTRA